MTVSNAVLQALGRPGAPLRSMAVGTAVKIAAEYLLVGTASIGIYGAPISTLLCNLTVMALNHYQMKRYAPHVQGMGILYARPVCASVPAIIGALAVFCAVGAVAPERLATLAALVAAVLLYGFTAFRFGAVTVQDLALIPGGERLADWLEKRKARKHSGAPRGNLKLENKTTEG
jgi:stage V sporulation protein B